MKQAIKQFINGVLGLFNLKLVSAFRGQLAGHSLQHDLQVLLPQPHSVCFDIGANVGQTIDLLTDSLDVPWIYAFEPSKQTFAQLEQCHGKTSGIELFRCGVGEVEGELEFHTLGNSQLSSFLRPKDFPWVYNEEGYRTSTEKVEVITIDQFCAAREINRINLLKSDTQGFELKVLKGAKNTLEKQAIDFILIEVNFMEMYQEQGNHMEIQLFLEEHGYFLIDFYEKSRHPSHNQTLSWVTALFGRRQAQF